MDKKFLPLALVASLAILPLFGDSGNMPVRLSEVDGAAAVAREGDVDWVEATPNFPIEEQDRLISQDDSRVEVELNDGSFLRIGPNSDVRFDELSKDHVTLDLLEGELILRLRSSTDYAIRTSDAEFTTDERGLYRLNLSDGGQTEVVVRKGEMEVANQSDRRRLRSGERLDMTGPSDSLQSVSMTYVEDPFDLWSDRRDARYVGLQSARYLGGFTAAAGIYDLDFYGQWGFVSGFGEVWWPNVAVGWRPFCSGWWACRPGWGWTWVSYEPWGWLPYHYGRWVFVDSFSRWCWVPGGFSVWSPAMVDFYHGHGYVGWVPRYADRRWAGLGIRGRFGGDHHREFLRRGMTVIPEDHFGRRTRLHRDFGAPETRMVDRLVSSGPWKPSLSLGRRNFSESPGSRLSRRVASRPGLDVRGVDRDSRVPERQSIRSNGFGSGPSSTRSRSGRDRSVQPSRVSPGRTDSIGNRDRGRPRQQLQTSPQRQLRRAPVTPNRSRDLQQRNRANPSVTSPSRRPRQESFWNRLGNFGRTDSSRSSSFRANTGSASRTPRISPNRELRGTSAGRDSGRSFSRSRSITPSRSDRSSSFSSSRPTSHFDGSSHFSRSGRSGSSAGRSGSSSHSRGGGRPRR